MTRVAIIKYSRALQVNPRVLLYSRSHSSYLEFECGRACADIASAPPRVSSVQFVQCLLELAFGEAG